MTGPIISSRRRPQVPSAPDPNDLPPPYSAVVNNPQYGFVIPAGQPDVPPGQPHMQPGQSPMPADVPHMPAGHLHIPAGQPHIPAGQPHMPPGLSHVTPGQSHMPPGYMLQTCTAPGVYPHPSSAMQSQSQPQDLTITNVPVDVVNARAVGSEPTTVTCYNCGKVVTTRVTYKTAWQTHIVAGSICVITMVCSLCCLGLIPYCLDAFKDAEHYCPNCNTFIGKNNHCSFP